ncbi:hypothetical protein HanRHA438_Chr09g0426221 [Helianthus annuus]|nr:hypothetical protein HanRHA438_Chr09g0426221 [Helianthus annuus]
MTDPNSLHLQQLRKLVQSSMKTVTKLHQMLNVINGREKHIDQIKESGLCIGQTPASQNLQQITKIIPTVKRHPIHTVVQHNAGRH